MQGSVAPIDAVSPETVTPIEAVVSPETSGVSQAVTQAVVPPVPTIAAVCLKPNRIIGSRVYAQGDAVELTDQRLARRLYSEGTIYVADVSSLGDPAPVAPAQAAAVTTDPDPFAGQPLVSVVVERDSLTFRSSVLSLGQAVQVPERIAADWIFAGAAQLGSGVSLSSRGQVYLTKLESKNPTDFGPTY